MLVPLLKDVIICWAFRSGFLVEVLSCHIAKLDTSSLKDWNTSKLQQQKMMNFSHSQNRNMMSSFGSIFLSYPFSLCSSFRHVQGLKAMSVVSLACWWWNKHPHQVHQLFIAWHQIPISNKAIIWEALILLRFPGSIHVDKHPLGLERLKLANCSKDFYPIAWHQCSNLY